jgi:hypothetical protein
MTEAGKALLADWLDRRPEHRPNTAWVRDKIVEAESDASAIGAQQERERLRDIARKAGHRSVRHEAAQCQVCMAPGCRYLDWLLSDPQPDAPVADPEP